MKKMISLVLALVMICAMATTAFAADLETIQEDGSTFTIITDKSEGAVDTTVGDLTIDVEATYNNSVTFPESYTDVEASYFVVVTWDIESTLAYTVGGKYVWNAYNEDGNIANAAEAVSEAGYDIVYDADTTGWFGEATVNVTVENWSNRVVEANVVYTNEDGFEATVEYENDSAAEQGEDEEGTTLYLGTVAADMELPDAEDDNIRTSSSTMGTASVKISEMTFTGDDDAVSDKIAEIAEAVAGGENVKVGAVTVKLTGENGAEFESPVTSNLEQGE